MSKVFSSVDFLSIAQMYAGKWKVIDANSGYLPQSNVDRIVSATVVESKYGKSVCMVLTDGKQAFCPVERDSADVLAIGDELKPDSLFIYELEKDGEQNIVRMTGEKL